jgi:phosphoglycerate-specific signal transduction histidine kinase
LLWQISQSAGQLAHGVKDNVRPITEDQKHVKDEYLKKIDSLRSETKSLRTEAEEKKTIEGESSLDVDHIMQLLDQIETDVFDFPPDDRGKGANH